MWRRKVTRSKLSKVPSAARSKHSLTEHHYKLASPTIPAITVYAISAIYRGLTLCSWALVQALLLRSVTEWPPDRHIPSSLELEVTIIMTSILNRPPLTLQGPHSHFR